MRIADVTLTWFRGAADSVGLGPQGKSLVVYGQNGAGKSSFVDAVEYAICNGKVAHLSHEYSGRNQERAILNTHTPKSQRSGFSIAFADGSELDVAISKNGTQTRSGGDGGKIGEWDYRRTILRQDEVARFISARKGEKYSALLPLLGLHDLELAAENLRQLSRSVEEQAGLKDMQAALAQIGVRRKQTFGDDSDSEIADKVQTLHKAYCAQSSTTGKVEQCKEVEEALKNRIDALSSENQCYVRLRELAETKLSEAIRAVGDANAKLADSVDPLIAEKLSVLQSAEAYADKLTDENEVACPACGQTVLVERFRAHLEAEQTRLEEIRKVFNDRKAAITSLVDCLKGVKTSVSRKEVKGWRERLMTGSLQPRVEWLEKCRPDDLRDGMTAAALSAIEENCAPIIVEAGASTKDAPPDIKALSADRTLTEVASAIFGSAEMANAVASAQRVVAFVRALEVGARDEIRERSVGVIRDISDAIGAMWRTLHPDQTIENVRLYLPDDDKAIDIALKFHGKEQDSPRLTLSEGYRNSLGLCIFLAMAKREDDTDRPLFLDDVVVSLDRNHRGMIVQLLEENFLGRQVIVLTHDRDWYADLRQQLDQGRWSFRVLLPYENPDIGIRWSHKTTAFADARAHLKERPDSAGNDARKLMDVELAALAEKLQLRLPYLRGDKNDKRSWSDFMERLIGDGKRCLQKKVGSEFKTDNDGLEALESARRLLVTWGNRASHSDDIVRAEASKLIDACEKAVDAFTCKGCSKPLWFADAGNQEWVQCQCGELRWRYGKG